MEHTEKIVDGVMLKYICTPCLECKTKLDLFDRYKMMLEGLTPGGSEYVDDPERCAMVIRDRFAGPITILKRQKAKLQAGAEMATWLGLLIKTVPDRPDYAVAPTLRNLVEGATKLLSVWEKAGKGG